jgi:hypothetical protein
MDYIRTVIAHENDKKALVDFMVFQGKLGAIRRR